MILTEQNEYFASLSVQGPHSLLVKISGLKKSLGPTPPPPPPQLLKYVSGPPGAEWVKKSHVSRVVLTLKECNIWGLL